MATVYEKSNVHYPSKLRRFTGVISWKLQMGFDKDVKIFQRRGKKDKKESRS